MILMSLGFLLNFTKIISFERALLVAADEMIFDP